MKIGYLTTANIYSWYLLLEMVGLIAEIMGWIVFQCNGIEVLIVSFLYFCLSLNVLAELLIKCVGISCHFSNIGLEEYE